MLKFVTFTLATTIAATALFADPVQTIKQGNLSASEALAYDKDRGQARRTVRRTARRIERRQTRLATLPPHCHAVYVDSSKLFLCDDLYYRPVMESGRTVYVIATP